MYSVPLAMQPTKVQKHNSDMACPSPTWASCLSVSGLYYQGIVERDQLEKVLEFHKRDTMNMFDSSRVSSGAKAMKDLEKPSREDLEAEKENSSIQSSAKEQVRVHC